VSTLMSWVSTAMLSTAIFGAVHIIDSRLLSKRMPSLRSFMLPVGIIHIFYALVAAILFPLPTGIGTWPLLVAIVSGILRTASIVILLYIMKKEEVSRVVPVVYTYPIFVAIMAAPLLGENLYYLGWLAIIIVVAGAVLISIKQDAAGSTTWLGKPLLFLFGASLLMAMADITSKYALNYISFWNIFWLSTFCESVIFILASMHPYIFRQLSNMKQRNSVIGLLIFNETLAVLAVVLQFWALKRGPVSLVSTIISSRPIFVVIFALILSRISPRFLEWQPGREALILRLVAIAMIVSGIAIIYLI